MSGIPVPSYPQKSQNALTMGGQSRWNARRILMLSSCRSRHMIQVTPEIAIDEGEVHVSFVRSPGPGGQNVNKVATAVQLRFDAAHSASLTGRYSPAADAHGGQAHHRRWMAGHRITPLPEPGAQPPGCPRAIDRDNPHGGASSENPATHTANQCIESTTVGIQAAAQSDQTSAQHIRRY